VRHCASTIYCSGCALLEHGGRVLEEQLCIDENLLCGERHSLMQIVSRTVVTRTKSFHQHPIVHLT
jgi:hypothetical protein